MMWLLACSTPSPTTTPVAVEGRVFHLVESPEVVAVLDGQRLDFRPGMRSPRRIELTTSARTRHEYADCPWSEDKTVRWSDSTLTYATAVGCGGSGGIEAALDGVWSRPDGDWSVRCLTQDEVAFGPTPDPTWCLDLLERSTAE